MSAPGDGDRARRLVAWHEEHRPDVLALATAVALAVRVEPGLLRRARLRLTPGVPVGAEGDLWAGPLVASTSVRGLVLDPAVADLLRHRLAADRRLLDAAHEVVSGLHADAPPTLRLEEDLVHAALTGDAERIAALLATALRTAEREPDRAAGIGRWADRALRAAPPMVRDHPLSAVLVALTDRVLAGPVVVGVELTRRGIEFSEPPAPGAHALDLPPVPPLRVQVRPEAAPEEAATVEVVRGGVVRHRLRSVAARVGGVELRTADGRVARLAPAAARWAASGRAPKRLVVCCDGTWTRLDQERDGRPAPTNVTKVALAVAAADEAGVEQRVLYQQGVGTRPGGRLRGAALGVGLSQDVRAAYRFLVENHEPGDQVFLFGAGRGAYTARSVSGLVRQCGILRREHAGRIEEAYAMYRARDVRPGDAEAQLFRRAYSVEARIRFLGVWDTVGPLGIPPAGRGLARLVDRRWGFHDTMLTTAVDSAFQALAIDERRPSYAPSLWRSRTDAPDQQVEQVWFSGDHRDVTGGHRDSGLADIALLWMVDRARSCGLAFRPDALVRAGDGAPAVFDGRTFPVDPDPLGRLHDSRRSFARLQRPFVRAIGAEDPASESVASSAVRRLEATKGGYRPPALLRYLAGASRVTEVPTSAAPPDGALTG